MQVHDLSVDGVVAWRRSRIGGGCGADLRQARVDDLRVGHAHENVEATRPIFLEVGGLRDFNERIQEVSAIQRVGLEPLFSPSFSCGSGMDDDTEPAGHQISNDRLAGQRRRGFVVRLELGADDDHTHGRGRPAGVRNRAGIKAGERINGSVESVGQGLIEHVVGHLPRGIATTAGIVPKYDLEIA